MCASMCAHMAACTQEQLPSLSSSNYIGIIDDIATCSSLLECIIPMISIVDDERQRLIKNIKHIQFWEVMLLCVWWPNQFGPNLCCFVSRAKP